MHFLFFSFCKIIFTSPNSIIEEENGFIYKTILVNSNPDYFYELISNNLDFLKKLNHPFFLTPIEFEKQNFDLKLNGKHPIVKFKYPKLSPLNLNSNDFLKKSLFKLTELQKKKKKMIHGDLKLQNFMMSGKQLILIDLETFVFEGGIKFDQTVLFSVNSAFSGTSFENDFYSLLLSFLYLDQKFKFHENVDLKEKSLQWSKRKGQFRKICEAFLNRTHSKFWKNFLFRFSNRCAI